ncbi:MAG TPA: Mth938-like domain-containing protein [Steroidobacteraceae bacterium]
MQYVSAMKFHLDLPGGVNLIRGYGPGQLRVGDQVHAHSVILTATTIVSPWRPASAQELTLVDFEPVLGLGVDVVLLGTGPRQHFPDPQVLRALYERRVGIEVMDTSAACRTFNVLVAEGRPVAAALIV